MGTQLVDVINIPMLFIVVSAFLFPYTIKKQYYTFENCLCLQVKQRKDEKILCKIDSQVTNNNF